uniref:CCD97-like C-terminal domain-containing protein n=1 Tax=Photinus pyralis TaxID=7054 RepID=A0A1Y1K0S1_PHOPY
MAMECLVENLNEPPSKDEFDKLLEELSNNPEVLCKSQQRDEMDSSPEEKLKFLTEIFTKSKANFLSRFGRFLNSDEINLFQQFEEDTKDGYEVKYHLKNLKESSFKTSKRLRNKRFAALKRLVSTGAYFSETEMMKRNPLLYDQLVGRYLSTREKRLRDRSGCSDVNSFVSILMGGIEKEQMEAKRRVQEMEERDEEEDSSDSEEDTGTEKPVHTLWGEFREENNQPTKPRRTTKDIDLFITSEERELLKEEFVSTMYEHFLEGKDDDFDYNAVDNSEEYDNLEIITNDEEEKYFDSEEPEDVSMNVENTANVKEESSEDELDIYMSALNQHPSVCQLSEDIKKL